MVERCAGALWEAAIAGDEYAAVDAAIAAVEAGVPVETMILDVVAAVQARVGQAWADNVITVAQEHTATAVNESVLVVVAAHPAAREHLPAPDKGRICVACVDGEWHTFPVRLLAEVLRLRGWRVDYLGAHVPTPHLVVHLHRTGPDTVALSSSIATRLPAAHGAITACQAASTPVLVGGAAFGPDGRYARLLGADAWAPDARAAAELLDRGPLPRRAGTEAGTGAGTGAGAGTVAGREYVVLGERTPDLVRGVMDELRRHTPADGPDGAPDGGPAAGPRDRRLPGYTAEDVASIVDFLRAAAYVEDPTLFTSFAGWMARMLTARGVPEPALPAALDAMAARLADLPHARAALARARGAAPAGVRRAGRGRPGR
ncbi:cobalamin B12-binding domain-containing protein [Actinomadura sp. ATCC 31491]|uniref:Cobalamin B12-binding domain-containing protein n=1 Tax=Actinomadura luzonensis TaxID=2805427 RepID=A0ABT0G2A7_9ACTN|nr:cobalamin B12-binding domain-containing protein [Actinomadura luzonensis]MCK2218754.1 cobalamin B12-binding domain-containing protein [Actinomadura luzonensis]